MAFMKSLQLGALSTWEFSATLSVQDYAQLNYMVDVYNLLIMNISNDKT